MPEDKKPADRLFYLNDIFNGRFGASSVVTVKELEEILGVGRSILFQDFEKLRAMGAPLIHDKKLKGHRYTSIFPYADRTVFTPEELAHLRIGIELISKIHHLDGFQLLPSVFEKIRRSIRKWSAGEATQKAIFFDPLPKYDGGRHLAFLLQAIENQWKICFEYKAFHATSPKTVTFDPYFLRHYDRRWYVGGFSHDPSEGFIRTFPLERIVSEPVQTGYFHSKEKNYQPENYWKNIYGITIPPNALPEEIELAFTPIQGKYFINTPFFQPFNLVHETETETVIRMRLIPNIDLERKLASYGKDVRVLKPQWLREKIRQMHREAWLRYKESAAG